MAQPKYRPNEPIKPAAPEANKAEWQRTPGSFLNGQAYVDHVDGFAVELESKWGVGRLRLLADPALAAKFDRQVYKFNRAIIAGKLDEVQTEAKRMAAAWRALDHDATQRGAGPLSPDTWEVGLADGSVAVLCQSDADAAHVIKEGRSIKVYTLAEIGNLIDGFPEIAKAKDTFSGATVVAARRVRDPLDRFADAGEPLDDIPF